MIGGRSALTTTHVIGPCALARINSGEYRTGRAAGDTLANSERVQPKPEVFQASEVLQSAYHHVNTLHTMLGDERVSGVERELASRHLPETRQLPAELLGE
eukprot:scaffold110990_cov75-Phaeocystis_antarctica.AAC.1